LKRRHIQEVQLCNKKITHHFVVITLVSKEPVNQNTTQGIKKFRHNTAQCEGKKILHNMIKFSNKGTKKCVKTPLQIYCPAYATPFMLFLPVLYSDGTNEKNYSCPQQNHYLFGEHLSGTS
jgi:hypothetical protein